MTQDYYTINAKVVPSSGLSIDLGPKGFDRAFVTLVETAGIAWTVNIGDANGNHSDPIDINPNGPFVAGPIPNIRFITITGSGATLTGKVSDYAISPETFLTSGVTTITGSTSTSIVSNGGSDPVNVGPSGLTASPMLVTYTVPASQVLTLNALAASVIGPAVGSIAVTDTKLVLIPQGLSVKMVLLEDSVGGSLSSGQTYQAAVYEAGSPVITGATLSKAGTLAYPQILASGDSVQFILSYTGTPNTATVTLSPQGVLHPL